MARKKLAKLPGVDPEAQKIFDTYWKDLVCYKNGKLKLAAVINELSDYTRVTTEVSKVYMELTNGRLSKPNYLASVIINEVNDANNEVWAETLADEKKQWQKEIAEEIKGILAAVLVEKQVQEKEVQALKDEIARLKAEPLLKRDLPALGFEPLPGSWMHRILCDVKNKEV